MTRTAAQTTAAFPKTRRERHLDHFGGPPEDFSAAVPRHLPGVPEEGLALLGPEEWLNEAEGRTVPGPPVVREIRSMKRTAEALTLALRLAGVSVSDRETEAAVKSAWPSVVAAVAEPAGLRRDNLTARVRRLQISDALAVLRQRAEDRDPRYAALAKAAAEVAEAAIKSRKVVVLLRGLPGAGKSTVAHAIRAQLRTTGAPLSTLTVSADDWFMREGRYEFTPKGLKAAHAMSQGLAQGGLYSYCPADVVFVDNTNIRRWEMQPYLDMAEKAFAAVVQVQVTVRAPRPSGHRTVADEVAEVLAARNTHGVPKEVILRRMGDWEDLPGVPSVSIPSYDGR